jgi:hypothetical protein
MSAPMSKMNLTMCAALLLLPVTLSGNALAACSARFEGGNQAWLGAYNPFAPTDTVTQRNVRLTNLSGDNCRYRLYFRRSTGVGSFSARLQYALLDTAGQSLLTEHVGLTSDRYALSPTVSWSADFAVNFSASLSRGQVGGPGVYADRIETVLYSENGQVEIDRQDFWLWMPVESVAMINVSGGGVSTSVPFGKLSAGASRTVIVEARANTSYTVELLSAHGGSLLIDPPVPGQSWFVPYRTSLDGIVIEFGTKNRFEISSGGSGVRSHSLTLQILDATGKRAGTYRDVITARVSVAY